MTYGASGLPAGLSINPASGVISGTISATPGTYPVTVTVTDSINTPVQDTFSWTVAEQNVAPVLSPISDQTTQQSTYVELQVLATDVNNDVLTYGASSLPAGLSINPTSGLISGTVTASPGQYAASGERNR